MNLEDLIVMLRILAVAIVCAILSIYISHQEMKEDEKRLKSEKRIKADFDKVQSVIRSCKTQEHLESARNMVDAFKKLHEKNEDRCDTMCAYLYESIKHKKL